MPQETVERVIRLFLDEVIQDVKQSGYTRLDGFGSFRVKCRKSKIGRDFGRNEGVIIPSKLVPQFVPSKKFDEEVNAPVAQQDRAASS